MSGEQIKIHHSSMADVTWPESSYTSHWPDVTCGQCRLEQPMEAEREYSVPADVLKRDASLAAADRRARQIREVRELEDVALAEVRHWALALADATSLRERIEAAAERDSRERDGVVDKSMTADYAEGMTNLSEAAKTALINAAAHQGAPVVATQEVLAQLILAELIGFGGGLTRKGTIARERLVRAAEDKAFG